MCSYRWASIVCVYSLTLPATNRLISFFLLYIIYDFIISKPHLSAFGAMNYHVAFINSYTFPKLVMFLLIKSPFSTHFFLLKFQKERIKFAWFIFPYRARS